MRRELKDSFHYVAWRRGESGHLYLRGEYVWQDEETLSEVVRDGTKWRVVPWSWGHDPAHVGPMAVLSTRFPTARAAKQRAEAIVLEQLVRGDDRWR